MFFLLTNFLIEMAWDFPGGSVVKNQPVSEEDTGSVLVWEDPTHQAARKSMHHNYWTSALEPRSRNNRAYVL